jgi:hypothetical protein
LKKIFGTLILILISLSCALSQDNCVLKKDHDGIKVYTCHTDTSRFKSIVAEVIINSTLNELLQLLMNIPQYTEWQFNTIEAKPLKRISSSEQIYHSVVEAPWPVIDRDMVTRIRINFDADKKEASIDAEGIKGILAPSEKYVRVPASHAHWIIKQESEKKLRIRYTMQIDPGGSVPTWLVNWAAAQAPYQSFKNIKEILEKKN